jgi:tyrosyl-tRNA synthetase
MQSVHLNIQDSVYEQFLSFLGKFKNNEVIIIEDKNIEKEDINFIKDKMELHRIYDRYKSGNSKKYSQEEFESILEEKNKLV